MRDDLRDEAVLRSRDLAELADTTPRALRHYHRIGLLPEAPRDANGYRRYGAEDVVRLLRIRQLVASGVPLRRIGAILDRDARGLDELFVELDEELRERADRIEAQRHALARLRRVTRSASRFSSTERVTRTQELDRDLWTLLAATDDADERTVAALLDALDATDASAQAGAWYEEFERLEEVSHIDDAEADRLAHRIAEVADAVVATAGISPASDELPIMPLVEQMQEKAHSAAQQAVWNRFLALVEERWGSGPDTGRPEPRA